MARRARRRALVTALAALPVALLAASSSPRALAADDVDRTLDDIARAREKLKTLVTRFTQERTLSLLATTVTSKGELTLVRPDRLRWELFPPDEAIYWITPDGVAYRTPRGSGKAGPGQAGPLGAVFDDLLLLLGGDLRKLRERYNVAVDRQKDAVTLTLTPKNEKVAKLVRRAVVELASDLLTPRRLILEEPSDDQTRIVFDSQRLNVPVDPARMRPS